MQLRWSTGIGTASKFAVPLIDGNRVYVGTRDGQVRSYGSPVTSPLVGAAVTFPTATVGQSSAATAVLTANFDLTVNSFSVAGAGFGAGVSSPPVPTPVAKNGTISVPLTFTPTSATLFAGTLSLDQVRAHLRDALLPRLVAEDVVTLPATGLDQPGAKIQVRRSVWDDVKVNRERVTEDVKRRSTQGVAIQPARAPMFTPSTQAKLTSRLEAKGLVKTYKKRSVVNNVALHLRQGEIVGLLGPNGAGKTTTFYMIVGLIQPQSGQIILDGKDITNMPMWRTLTEADPEVGQVYDRNRAIDLVVVLAPAARRTPPQVGDLWLSVPVDVLKNSFYAPITPPANMPLPYSDAGLQPCLRRV